MRPWRSSAIRSLQWGSCRSALQVYAPEHIGAKRRRANPATYVGGSDGSSSNGRPSTSEPGVFSFLDDRRARLSQRARTSLPKIAPRSSVLHIHRPLRGRTTVTRCRRSTRENHINTWARGMSRSRMFTSDETTFAIAAGKRPDGMRSMQKFYVRNVSRAPYSRPAPTQPRLRFGSCGVRRPLPNQVGAARCCDEGFRIECRC